MVFQKHLFIGEKFINKKSIALILGDNFFMDKALPKRLKKKLKQSLDPLYLPTKLTILKITE